jgi:hypothetical protein
VLKSLILTAFDAPKTDFSRAPKIRRIFERFFKFCKKGLNLQKIHKCTESASKTIIITVFLARLITTLGYNTKTSLQKLSES